MSVPQSGSKRILRREELLAVATGLISGARRDEKRKKIGIEVELPFFSRTGLSPIPFDGEGSITAVFKELCKTGVWAPNEIENGNITSLKSTTGLITLEPGGQIEFSTAARYTLDEIRQDIDQYYKSCAAICKKLDIDALPFGFHPHLTVEACPYIWQRTRFAAQRPSIEAEGGCSAWSQSCSVQVTIDAPQEADVFASFRLGLLIQPFVAAMFANSPFSAGRDSGCQSWRQEKIRAVDSPLYVVPEALFEDGYGMADWAAHVLSVPMITIVRENQYIAVAQKPFQDMVGVPIPELARFPRHEQCLTEQDLLDHITSIKPEILLKPNALLEFRAADLGPSPQHWTALPAFWAGIFYDESAFRAAREYVAGWSKEDRAVCRQQAAVNGLKGRIGGKTVRDIALDLLRISKRGLLRSEPESADMLDLLLEQVRQGVTPADMILASFKKNNEDMDATLRQSFLFFPEKENAAQQQIFSARESEEHAA